jgi:ribonucleoside-diphosphate reductase alpha chain
MTETVSGSQPDAGTIGDGSTLDRPEVIRTGMTISRIFTTPGVHPYDEVTWERREVVQNNWKTGEVVFEQQGVEFPDFWSVISSTIVTLPWRCSASLMGVPS